VGSLLLLEKERFLVLNLGRGFGRDYWVKREIYVYLPYRFDFDLNLLL
jgi:hypothetical protein